MHVRVCFCYGFAGVCLTPGADVCPALQLASDWLFRLEWLIALRCVYAGVCAEWVENKVLRLVWCGFVVKAFNYRLCCCLNR